MDFVSPASSSPRWRLLRRHWEAREKFCTGVGGCWLLVSAATVAASAGRQQDQHRTGGLLAGRPASPCLPWWTKAAGLASEEYRGSPRPMLHKEKGSAARRRATSSVKKATLARCCSSWPTVCGLSTPSSVGASAAMQVGIERRWFGTEDPWDRFAFFCFFRVFCALC